MFPEAKINAAAIPDLIMEMDKKLRFVSGAEPYFVYALPEKKKGDLLAQAEYIVRKIAELCRQSEKIEETCSSIEARVNGG